jgi:hypothetical protein
MDPNELLDVVSEFMRLLSEARKTDSPGQYVFDHAKFIVVENNGTIN